MKRSELKKIAENIKAGLTRKVRFEVGDTRDLDSLSIHKMKVTGNDLMSEKVRKFQIDSDNLLLTAKILSSPGNIFPIQKLQAYSGFKTFLEDSELKKAMTLTTHADWVPTDFSRDFIDRVMLELKVAALFVELPMARGKMDFSRKNAFSSAYKKTEGSDAVVSQATSGKMSMDAVTICDYQEITYELDEDAAFAQAPMMREDAITGIGRAIESCIVRGDTSLTHMDSDVTLAYDARKCWKGLVKHALERSYTSSLSTFTAESVLGMKASMGSPYGADASKLAWIAGVGVAVSKLPNLKDSSNNRIYLENGTPGAASVAMLPGRTGVLGGSPVLVSEFMREDLNASGVYDASVITKGSLLLVRTDGFARGVVRNILVETDKNIVSQKRQLVVSTRMDFQPRYLITANKVVWYGYNVTI